MNHDGEVAGNLKSNDDNERQGAMTVAWYFERDGHRCGPFSGAQMQELAASGRLQVNDLVRRGADGKSVPAEQVKGLFSNGAAKNRPAPPPPALPHLQSRDKNTASMGSTTSARAGNSTSSRKVVVLSVVAGACLFLCCGGLGLLAMFGMKMENTTRKQLAEGDALWDKGDKPGEVGKYRDIIDNQRAVFLKEEDRPRLYGRVIDYEYESGHADAGKKLIDEADRNNIAPAVSHPDAKAVVAAKQAERAVAGPTRRRRGSTRSSTTATRKSSCRTCRPSASTTRKRASLNGTSGKSPFPTSPRWTSYTARTASQSRW